MADELQRQVFAIGWEQDPAVALCAHQWASVPFRTSTGGVDFVEKCSECGAPRCPREGCRDHRHHDGVHVFEDGSFEPIGGCLTPIPEGSAAE